MFELPPLPYPYDALEPVIEKRTVEFQHDKHQQTYTNNLNAAIKGTDLEGKTIDFVMSVAKDYPAAVQNNAGGYYNHAFYWTVVGPKRDTRPSATLSQAIDKSFGSFDKFKEQFTASALGQFGSGWAWLVVKGKDELAVCSTLNQDNPIMNLAGKCCGIPILTIDVWEHAYYLDYQNRRADYVEGFYKIIDWTVVSDLYEAAIKKLASGGCSCGCGK